MVLFEFTCISEISPRMLRLSGSNLPSMIARAVLDSSSVKMMASLDRSMWTTFWPSCCRTLSLVLRTVLIWFFSRRSIFHHSFRVFWCRMMLASAAARCLLRPLTLFLVGLMSYSVSRPKNDLFRLREMGSGRGSKEFSSFRAWWRLETRVARAEFCSLAGVVAFRKVSACEMMPVEMWHGAISIGMDTLRFWVTYEWVATAGERVHISNSNGLKIHKKLVYFTCWWIDKVVE